jgi:16S rRNA processing protein RimM
MVLVGTIAAPHGVRGQVKIRPLMERPETLARLPGVLVHFADGKQRTVRVSDVRRHGDAILLTFADVPDRNAAEALRDASLYIRESELPPLEPDAYYATQLVGLGVVTDTGRDLGAITEVHFYPANDVYETDRALIPAVGSIVLSVDLAERRVVVRDMPGLCKDE